MKKQILSIFICLISKNYIYSAAIKKPFLEHKTKQIANAIGQEHFPADVASIIAGYAVKDPLEFIRKHGRRKYIIYPVKKAPDIYLKNNAGEFVDRESIAYDPIFNPKSTSKGFYFLEISDYNPDIQKMSSTDFHVNLTYGMANSKKVVDDWTSLGIVILYLLGVRKFNTAAGVGTVDISYYPTIELKQESIGPRRKMSDNELQKTF